MATLKITYADLYTLVSNFLGITDTGTAPTGTDLTLCKDICERGLRQFLYPIDRRSGIAYEWSFLRPLYTINLLDGKWKYSLPEDFSSIITHPTYKDDENFKEMAKVSPEQIMNLRATGIVNYAPYYYAINALPYEPSVGSFYEIWFYPEPDSSYPIQFFYKSDPSKPNDSTDYLPGGIRATEAIIESCLAVAESQEDDMATTHHTELAAKLVQDLIDIDSQQINRTHLGNLYSDKRLYTDRTNIADLTVFDEELD